MNPDFDPQMWVSFGLRHTLARLRGDRPGKCVGSPLVRGSESGGFLGFVWRERGDLGTDFYDGG